MTEQITTAEQLLHRPDLGRCELVRGEVLKMSSAGFEHGRIVVRITGAIFGFLKENPIGVLTGAETGFQIGHNPDTVRAPDVAFVRADRVPASVVPGFFRGAPDLAVEVLSPDDRAGEVLAKAQEWLEAGCRNVWVIDPRTRTVSLHRSRREITVLSDSESITAGDLLPGFSVPVAEIFATPRP
jgi:Uma2 family endonuclease